MAIVGGSSSSIDNQEDQNDLQERSRHIQDVPMSIAITRPKNKHIPQIVRDLVISALSNTRKTLKEIAADYKISKSSVANIKKFFETEARTVCKRKGGNRKKLLTEEQKDQILDWIDADCTLTHRKLIQLCSEKFNVSPSEATLSRTFKDFHYSIKRTTLQP